MTIELLAQGAGKPSYLAIQANHAVPGALMLDDIHDLLENVEVDLDKDLLYVVTKDGVARVKVQCTDPDEYDSGFDWEVTLVDDGDLDGELVERVEYAEDGNPTNQMVDTHIVHVNGF